MTSPIYCLLGPDGNPLQAPILGRGRTGVTIQDRNTALKLPVKYGIIGYDNIEEDDTTAESLQLEKEGYQGLEYHNDIVSCLDLSGVGIRLLALMGEGNLQKYFEQNQTPPDQSRQLAWFRAMARALVHVQDRYILAADIATRNFLLSADLEVKLSDFNQSTILPLNTEMETADDDGYSIYTDIGQLGAVFYTVATGQVCELDLFKGLPFEPISAIWPQRKDLPSTENIWTGPIIERCWTKASFQNIHELLEALDSVILSLNRAQELIEHYRYMLNPSGEVTATLKGCFRPNDQSVRSTIVLCYWDKSLVNMSKRGK